MDILLWLSIILNAQSLITENYFKRIKTVKINKMQIYKKTVKIQIYKIS